MARRSHRTVQHRPRAPETVLPVPVVESPAVEAPASVVPAVAFTVSHGPGSDPSRVPQLTEEQQEAVNAAANSISVPPREKTLHELNIEARAIDRWHYDKRNEAQQVAKQTLEPMLTGVMRPRQIVRRVQKSLRPPVKP